MKCSLLGLVGLEGLTKRIRVVVFGKHPTTPDYIEEIGLSTPALVQAYKLLFEGIKENTTGSDGWSGLSNGQLIGFDHKGILDLGSDIIAVRIWPSRDSTEKREFPLIVCVQCSAAPLEWVLGEVLPCLDGIGETLVETSSLADVMAHVRDLERHLNERLRSDRPKAGPCKSYGEALAQLAQLPELSAEGTDLVRTLYHISERDLLAKSGEPFLVRIPLSKTTAPRSVAGWLRLLRAKYGKKVPLIGIWRNEGSWLDLFIGGLLPRQLYCIRVPAACALATSIPYPIDPGFWARYEQILKRARSGLQHR